MEETRPLVRKLEGEKSWNAWIRYRYVVWLLASFGMFTVFTLRVNISVALVAMVNHTHLDIQRDSWRDDDDERSRECPWPGNSTNGTTQRQENEDGEFEWNEGTQGVILGAFYYGYILTQMPGGWISSKYGGKWPFGLGVLMTGLLTLLTPTAAGLGEWYIIVLRAAEGFFEGVTFPSIYAVISRWSPPLERSIMVSGILVGSSLGTVITMPVAGYLSKYGFAGGWPSVFYVSGIVSIVWFVLWTWLVSSGPESHPHITRKEREYIITSIGVRDTRKEGAPVPWGCLLRSKPVWALVIAYFCNTWGTFTLMTNLPLYMNEVLHFGIESNGVFSALPYALNMIVTMSVGVLADWILREKYASAGTVRKTMNSIGMFSSAILLLAAGFSGCDSWSAVICFTLAVGLGGFVAAGHCCSHLDLTPEFAGMLMAVTNTLSTITGMVGPLVVGFFTNHEPTLKNWMYVFYIAAILYVTGAVVFLVFGSAEKQAWSSEEPLIKFTTNNKEKITNDLEKIKI